MTRALPVSQGNSRSSELGWASGCAGLSFALQRRKFLLLMCRFLHRCLRTILGQKHLKTRITPARTAVAVYANGAIVPLHDTTAYPETHAASLLALGGEERLEKMLARGRGNSHATVQQRHQHASAQAVGFATMSHVNAELATFGHRVNSIHDEIREHLTQFRRKARDFSLPVVTLVDLDLLRADLLAIQKQNSVNELGDIHWHHL